MSGKTAVSWLRRAREAGDIRKAFSRGYLERLNHKIAECTASRPVHFPSMNVLRSEMNQPPKNTLVITCQMAVPVLAMLHLSINPSIHQSTTRLLAPSATPLSRYA